MQLLCRTDLHVPDVVNVQVLSQYHNQSLNVKEEKKVRVARAKYKMCHTHTLV